MFFAVAPQQERICMPTIPSWSFAHSLKQIVLVAALLALIAPLVVAQTDTARLTGTVTDASGAVVPGASITVTNTGTLRAVTVTSEADGNFVVAALPPGAYQVEVKQAGFRMLTQKITLQTQQV